MYFSQKNKGSALAISLVILTAITLISVSSLQKSGLQTRMVGNIKHKENNFHSNNNDLEGLFQYYIKGTNKDDTSSEAVAAFEELYNAANSDSNFVNGKEIYDPLSTGYDSNHADPHSDITVVSNIQFQNATAAPGYSSGLFKNHNYNLHSSAAEPNRIAGDPDQTVSSQTMGVKFLAPAG